MKEKRKQLLAIVMVLVMIIATAPAMSFEWLADQFVITASAASSILEGTCGDNIKFSFQDDVLYIEGYGEMYDYQHSSKTTRAPWYGYERGICFVSISDGITHIGNDAFYNMTQIKVVTIPKSVVSIGSRAFSNASELSNIYYEGSLLDWAAIQIENDNTAINTNVIQYNSLITFGSYPQKDVSDDTVLVSALEKEVNHWESYQYYSGNGYEDSMVPSDYMRYSDVVYNDSRYRCVVLDSYRPYETDNKTTTSAGKNNGSFQDEKGYLCGAENHYWFKYEPIRWIVLDASINLIIAERVIDAQPFNNCMYYNGAFYNDPAHKNYCSDYEKSSIREWLNDDFYNTAFSATQQSKILTSDLNNEGYYTIIGTAGYEKLDSNPTEDKVFLPSYRDTLQGPLSAMGSFSASASDYAQAQGWRGYGWRLRNPGSLNFHAGNVSEHGSVDGKGCSTKYVFGIRPEIRISELKSDLGEKGIAFERDTYSLIDGEQFVLKPIINLPEYTKTDFCWQTSDSSAVSVQEVPFVEDVAAVIKAQAKGHAFITVSTKDGLYEATCLVSVGEKFLLIAAVEETTLDNLGTYLVGLVNIKDVRKNHNNRFEIPKLSNVTDEELSNITFVIGNSSIAAVHSFQKENGYLKVKIKGFAAGTTYAAVTNVETGEAQYFQIAIHDQECTYKAGEMPETVKATGIFNFSYKCFSIYDFESTLKSNGDRDVSFDVYSSASNIGSVDVHNADGSIENSYRVSPYANGNPTDFFEDVEMFGDILERGGYIVKSWVTGTGVGESDMTAKKTSIHTTIPENGYISITADVNASVSCFVYNAIEITVSLISKGAKLIAKGMTEDENNATKEEVAKPIIQQVLESLNYSKDSDKVKKVSSVIKELTKAMTSGSGAIDPKNFRDLFSQLCANIEIDFLDLLTTSAEKVVKSAVNVSFEIAEKYNSYIKAANTLYKIYGKIKDIEYYSDLQRNKGQGAAYIYNDQIGTYRISNGIKLDGNRAILNDDQIIFRTYEITYGDTVDALSQSNPNSKLYDIALVKNNKITQPTEGKVLVYIPIPYGWEKNNLKIYRINDDGTKTDMNASPGNHLSNTENYMIFETGHFSLYAIVEEKNAPSDMPAFSLGSAECKAGETVSLPVTISGNPGICTAKLTVSYNKNQLELVSASNGTVLTEGFTPGGDVAQVPYSVVWNSGTKESKSNGTMVTFTFKVKASVAAGTKAAVSLSYSKNDTLNIDLDPVTFQTQDGSITVKGSSATLTKIAVKTMPTKTTYNVGDSFNQSGLTLTATYSDGSTKTITSGFSCSGFSSTTTGTKTITVSYEGKTTTFTVQVVQTGSVTLSVTPKQKVVNPGEQADYVITASGLPPYDESEPSDQYIVKIYRKDSWDDDFEYWTEYALSKDRTLKWRCWSGYATTVNLRFDLVRKGDSAVLASETAKWSVLDTLSFEIHNYVPTRTVDYRTTITFSVDINYPIPKAYIAWYIDGEYKGKGNSFTVENATKSFTVQAKYFPENGGLAYDISEIETVNVKTGFFARLKAFFRALFGLLPKVTQDYLGVERIDRILP